MAEGGGRQRGEKERMKSPKALPRIEPRRTGNALIIAIVLLSLCILSVIKARYCSPSYQTKPIETSAMATDKNREAALPGEDNLRRDGSYQEYVVVNSSKLACSATSKRSIVCEAEGDVRIEGSSQTIFLHRSSTDVELRTKPYARKHDPPAMSNVTEWTIKPFSSESPPPRCTARHKVPALVFSVGGYTGNLFHDYTDVIIPLFVSSYQFRGEVQFVISDTKPWWVPKFISILKQLSNYDIIDVSSREERGAVRCFPRVIVGLNFHKELGVNASNTPAPGYSVAEFRELLRRAYGLERRTAAASKPRLLIISRKKTRVLLNERGVAELAADLGFEVRAAEANRSTDVGEFARLVNSADVMLGVHGAGLTNMVFLPEGAVLVQVVPLSGLGWLARDTFEVPAPDMGIRYLAYHVREDESTLSERYPEHHPVLKDPMSIHKKGWNAISKTYLENQNVRPRLDRLRNTLLEALKLLPRDSKEAEPAL